MREGAAQEAGWVAAVLVAVALVYLGAVAGEFVWDDHVLVEEHPAVTQLQPLPDYFLRMFWSDTEHNDTGAFYRPLTTLSYAVEYALWGPDPRYFHFTNLLLHLAVCALVFELSRRAGAAPGTAAAAAALFGLLPRATESVAWVSGRTDLLAALGALAAWWLHRSEPTRGGRRVAAAAALLVGLLCKEVAAAGAVAIATLEALAWRRGRQSAERALGNLLPLAVALAGYGSLRAAAWSAGGAGLGNDLAAPWHLRPLFALQALGSYAGMLLDPLRPQLLIGTRGYLEWPWIVAGAGVALALAFAAPRLWRRAPAASVAGCAFAGAALLPVLHLVSLPLPVIAADRFLYLPVAGLAVALAAAARTIPPRALQPARVMAMLAIGAFAWATAARALDWSDDPTLFRTAMARSHAANPSAPTGLGEAHFRREQFAEALQAYREAERRHAEAGRRAPWAYGYPETIHTNIGLCLLAEGRTDEATGLLAGATARTPTVPSARFNLAFALAHGLDFDGAERELRTALVLRPDFERARVLLASVERARRDWEALPLPDPDEATDVQAARARVFTRVGHRIAASALWTRVIDAPDATPDQVRGAAVYLVMGGEPADARRALRRLKGIPSQAGEARRLELALAARLS